MSVAVVIPVRDRPQLLAEAIESIQAQTLRVDEIIVVDDASTDQTPDVALEMAKRDARIRLLRQPERGGASKARNLGVAQTDAEYIAFLDSDDLWSPNKLQLQLAKLHANPKAVASFTGIRYLQADGYKDEPLPAALGPTQLREINVLGSTSTAVVRRDTFLDVGGFDEGLPSCQDWDLWLRLERAGDFELISDPLLIYRRADTARISANPTNVLNGHKIVFARALVGASPAAQRRIKAYHQLRLTQIHLWDFNAPMAAMNSALRSLALRPTKMGLRMLLWSAQGRTT